MGNISDLWDEFLTDASKREVKPKASQNSLQESNARRARICASENDLSKACSALTSLGMAEASHSNLDILKSKHPEGGPVQVPDLSAPPLQISSQDVFKQILSFPRSSGPGPSGERPSHLIEAVKAPASGSAEKALESTGWQIAFWQVGPLRRCLSGWLGPIFLA